MTDYFITAIGTDCGKTLISAIVTRAVQADYWKPVQCGFPTDTEQIKEWMKDDILCHPERFLLTTPASPHLAAAEEKVNIRVSDFIRPAAKGRLVIEGAGGMLVPLNDREYVIDLAGRLRATIILVCNIYLGSINHSLLSIGYLKNSELPVAGIIFNGMETPSTESIIEAASPWPVLLKVRPEQSVDREVIERYAELLRRRLDHS